MTKAQIQLRETLCSFESLYGKPALGFMTLTFPEAVSSGVAMACLKSFEANYLPRFKAYIRVIERGEKSGRVHFHIVVVRVGADWTAENAALTASAAAYGFGRVEVAAMLGTVDSVTSYITKSLAATREFVDKGVRRIAYSKGAKVCSSVFAVLSRGNRYWRQKLAAFVAALIRIGTLKPGADERDLKVALGKTWCWHWKEWILSLPPDPDKAAAVVLAVADGEAPKYVMSKRERADWMSTRR